MRTLPHGWSGRIRCVVVLLSAAGVAVACGDATSPLTPPDGAHSPGPAAPPALSTTSEADPPPPGIGGAVTITASGSFLPDVPMQPTGLQIPPGIPVVVEVTGEITRAQTDGLKTFCSFFVALCSDFAFFLGEDPVPPSGVSVIDAAVAFAAWDGGEGAPASEGSPAILTGASGSELWVGRSQFFCEYDWALGAGPCFTFGGGYTYTVRADDGSDDPASADLLLDIVAQDVTSSGGTVDLEVRASDASPLADVRWYFVPDGGGVIDGGEPEIIAVAGAQGATASQEEARVELAGEMRQVLRAGSGAAAGEAVGEAAGDAAGDAAPSVRTAPDAGPEAPRVGAGASAAPAATASWTSLSHCDGSAACDATISVSAGTFVATAAVHGTPRAAERRVSEGTSGGGGGSATLIVGCEPQEVVRGQTVTCTASLEPPADESTLVITGWSFRPDAVELQEIERTIGREELTWSGKMVTGGTLTVTGQVDDGPEQAATARIEVTNRPPLTVEFAAPPLSDDPDMSERPFQIPGQQGIFHLGHVHLDYAIRVPGNVDVVGGGPNEGLAFFIANPYEADWAIHVNLSQLQRDSELARRHRERRPAFESTETCIRSQLPTLVEPIAEHEGTTMHPKSHAGRYASTFNELAGPAIEALVVQDDLLDAVDQALEPSLTAAAAESALADEDFKPRLCRLDLFPAPR